MCHWFLCYFECVALVWTSWSYILFFYHFFSFHFRLHWNAYYSYQTYSIWLAARDHTLCNQVKMTISTSQNYRNTRKKKEWHLLIDFICKIYLWSHNLRTRHIDMHHVNRKSAANLNFKSHLFETYSSSSSPTFFGAMLMLIPILPSSVHTVQFSGVLQLKLNDPQREKCHKIKNFPRVKKNKEE